MAANKATRLHGRDDGDVASTVRLACLKALGTWDPGKGRAYSTWCVQQSLWALRNEVVRSNRPLCKVGAWLTNYVDPQAADPDDPERGILDRLTTPPAPTPMELEEDGRQVCAWRAAVLKAAADSVGWQYKPEVRERHAARRVAAVSAWLDAGGSIKAAAASLGLGYKSVDNLVAKTMRHLRGRKAAQPGDRPPDWRWKARDARRERLKGLLEGGSTLKSAAAAVGCGYMTAWSDRVAMGLPGRAAKSERLKAQREERAAARKAMEARMSKALQLLAVGAGVGEAAKACGLGLSTLYRLRRRGTSKLFSASRPMESGLCQEPERMTPGKRGKGGGSKEHVGHEQEPGNKREAETCQRK
jgi:transposase